jgi:hypothetical protein
MPVRRGTARMKVMMILPGLQLLLLVLRVSELGQKGVALTDAASDRAGNRADKSTINPSL